MTHWSGTRSGWNTRGGLTTREEVWEAQERSNPNSRYWQDFAQVELTKVIDFLGDNFDLWAEMQPTNHTAKEMYQNCYNTLNTPLADVLAELECDCNGVTEPCKVCQAYARLTAQVESDAELVE